MRRRRKFLPRSSKCVFCQPAKKSGSVSRRTKKVLDYKEAEVLKGYLTDRGKIINRSRTGLCAKHQRRLNREIKRARHLALLPFVTRV